MAYTIRCFLLMRGYGKGRTETSEYDGNGKAKSWESAGPLSEAADSHQRRG